MVLSRDYQIQPASMADIPTLVQHHRQMFEEIWTLLNLPLQKQKLKNMDVEYTKKLNEDLGNGACRAWIIRMNNIIRTSGAVSLVSLAPLPYDSSYKVAYLHSVFTEIEHRNIGLAAVIVNKAIEYCKSKKISRMFLHASEAGRPVYEKIGFRNSDHTMEFEF